MTVLDDILEEIIMEVLIRSRYLLESKGWIQHANLDLSGSHCLLGAVTTVIGNDADMQLFINVASALIQAMVDRGDHPHGIFSHPATILTEWNDEKGRTFADVQDLLGRAIT